MLAVIVSLVAVVMLYFINRFGRELYATFFRDYTEKVWGMPCEAIPAEWGAQRVKGLSISKAIAHFLKTSVGRRSVVRPPDPIDGAMDNDPFRAGADPNTIPVATDTMNV